LSLEFRDVCFAYKNTGREALKNISLALAPGELTLLMGAAGAGKTTLCLAANGLVPKFRKGGLSGAIVVDDVDVTALPVAERARSVGLVFQDFEAQLFSTEVSLEVAFFPENLGVTRDLLAERVSEALRAVHMENFADRDPTRLSGGQQQRVVIASVLAGNPRAIVLDEPLSDLDPAGRSEVVEVLLGLVRDGASVLLVENDPVLAQRAHRVAVLHEGRLLAHGTPQEILRDNDLLRSADLPPHPLCDLFERLGMSARPLEVDEAAAEFPPKESVDSRIPSAIILQSTDWVLEARSVSFEYVPGRRVLEEVSIQVPRGHIVALLGHNGSGKSTLAQQFIRLLEPTSGAIFVDGRPVSEFRREEIGRHVGFIFQNPDNQIFAETVFDEVAFSPRQQKLSDDEVRARVNESLAAVELQGREDDDPFSMSRGERQCVAVASVLAARPAILIFDEPTTGLDAAQVKKMMALLVQLCDRGHTILMITHAMEIVAEYADEVVVLQAGRVLLQGPTSQVLHEVETLERAGLRPPPVVRLAHALRLPFLTAEDFR